MADKKILALSSSRVGDSGYLEKAVPMIVDLLGEKPLNIAFVAFAFVDEDVSPLVNMLNEALKALPYSITVVTGENGKTVLENSDAIMVSGGNTFKLLHDLYAFDLLETIRRKVNSGTPYIGWSAGSNITGATICTTNDMPIIEPESFKALNFFAFQINPHYYNIPIEGFNGETRDQRLTEFVKLNPKVPVVCLPEGTALLQQNGTLKLVGTVNGILMTNENGVMEKPAIEAGSELSYLL